MNAHIKIRTAFTCASCGGQFFDRHSCPSMPWGTTWTLPLIQVPSTILRTRAT